MSACEIETGYQLFARLIARPSLKDVHPVLISNSGPNIQEVIEVVGDTGTGKTLLITEFLARCLLPDTDLDVEIGGKDAGAIIINTDHHFDVSKLKEIMENLIEKCIADTNKSACRIKNIVLRALDNLIVLNCFSSEQLFVTFHNLQTILSQNGKISLVVLDSISAYYWSDRLLDGQKKIASYQKAILRALQNLTKEYKVVIMFTKPSHFLSKGESFERCVNQVTLEKVNYRIFLEKDVRDAGGETTSGVSNIFSATVTLPDNASFKKFYKITNFIEWIL